MKNVSLQKKSKLLFYNSVYYNNNCKEKHLKSYKHIKETSKNFGYNINKKEIT